ncbi:MAG: Fe2+-dependent dioxygenase [Deltaproteobacteria bacterium]|nr:Fe2+-dependent dioxygenase [Deltaproteobacteria bacterium]
MILHLQGVLSAEQLGRLRELVAREPFVDGSSTASGSAAQVKRNLQLPADSELTREAGQYLVQCLRAHPLFHLAAQPKTFTQPLFSRYEPGMSYGTHLDAPVLTRGHVTRSDVSITVFLSKASEYDGGDLEIDIGSAKVRLKGDEGDCLLYPATSFHRVLEVTRGSRRVAALWVQSVVRDAAQREILYDLGCALQFYETFGGGGPYVERTRKSFNNLFRMWAEI